MLARSPRLASGAGEEIMIPFVEEIVPEVVPSTEDEPGFVLLTPPAGLIDLVEDAEQDSAQATEQAGSSPCATMWSRFSPSTWSR